MPETIYIKVFRKSMIVHANNIKIKDIADISTSNPKTAININELVVCDIKEQKKLSYLVSITDIVKVIGKKYPNANLVPLGEVDAIVEYSPTPPKNNKVVEVLKIIVVSLVVFAGSSIAIMAYHVDTSLARTLSIVHKVFTGEVDDNPLWITIPYAIGLPIGVLLFFNHIGTKKLTVDPTPIEIEIDKYETDVEVSMIDKLIDTRRSGGE
ncbi:MAG: hypothetical protein BEN19_07050 [Epulopiscium sp. Nuni2H_MBin003]|nr:MAG: hypothetical protein BEN19_07050 [Epulopiscium sp. Nuni2H_MBin003]